MITTARAVPIAAAVLAGACASTVNHPDPAGPRFSGSYAGAPAPGALRVVTFNVKYGRQAARAASLLRYDPRLANADVVMLQEMDEASTDLVARALSVNYVYYPAVVHPASDRNFGNAILSPWPIRDDVKVLLPHRGRLRNSLRIAVGATIQPGGGAPVRVYSVHMETPAGISGSSRRDQAAAVLADARDHPRVIVAGDFNDRGILREAFTADGFRWLTRGIGPTISRFSWDHIAARGFRLRDCGSAGTIPTARDVSDHRPVWAELVADDDASAVAAPPCP